MKQNTLKSAPTRAFRTEQSPNKIQNISATVGVICFFLLMGVLGRVENEGISFVQSAIMAGVYLLGFSVSTRVYVHLSKVGKMSKVSKVRRRVRPQRTYVKNIFDNVAA